MRALALAAGVVLALPGCPAPRTGIAGESFEAIAARELPVHVRISGVGGSWAGITVVANVTAPDAAWAELTPTGSFRIAGVTQRLSGDGVELELDREWFTPETCTVDGWCTLDYVIALDAEPESPWDVALSITVDGDGADTARVEIVSP